MSFSEVVVNAVKSAERLSISIINAGNRVLNLADWCVLAAIVSNVSLESFALLAGTITNAAFVANVAIFAVQIAAPLILAHIIIEGLTLAVTSSIAARKFCNVK